MGEKLVQAKPEDVETSLLRPLTAPESTYVDALLARAFRKITAAASRAGVTPDPQTVVDVQADMVARVFRNPELLASETDGQYSYQLNTAIASGVLELTDAEKVVLGIEGFIRVWTPDYV